MQAQQKEIETGHRRLIGIWLKEHGKPSDTIFLEPVGYIGYFSDMKIADHPGLVNPEVVRLRREGMETFGQIVLSLRPEWVVLRPNELPRVNSQAGFKERYALVKVFDIRRQIENLAVPGKPYLAYDAVYLVFRRKDLPTL
jgi:hypothetical protein